jgi:hypothetical protein
MALAFAGPGRTHRRRSRARPCQALSGCCWRSARSVAASDPDLGLGGVVVVCAGSASLGVFMIVWAIFVNMVDNFIKPWLIDFGIAMPMSLTILGVFGGLLRSVYRAGP